MSRQYRSPQQWRELLAAFAQSGQTQALFCTEHGLTPSYFSKRRNEMLHADTSYADIGFVEAQPPTAPSVSAVCSSIASEQWLTVRYQHTELQLPLSVEPRWLANLVKELG